jgi:hypothetical protein
MDTAIRVLVVANRTADSTELLQRILARHARDPIVVTLLAPAVWEVEAPHGGKESALRRLRTAGRYLRSHGVEVSCEIGDPDPMTAFDHEWKRGRYDEIIVSTLPAQLSKWLRVDLPRRIQRAAAGTPVVHVVSTSTPVDIGST